jgi:hypothetical protein
MASVPRKAQGMSMNCLVCDGFMAECASCDRCVCGTPVCRTCLRDDPSFAHHAETIVLPKLDEHSFFADW